jgi:hypothetical protein
MCHRVCTAAKSTSRGRGKVGPARHRRKLARKHYAQAQLDLEPQAAPHAAREPEGVLEPDSDTEGEELDEVNFADVDDEDQEGIADKKNPLISYNNLIFYLFFFFFNFIFTLFVGHLCMIHIQK